MTELKFQVGLLKYNFPWHTVSHSFVGYAQQSLVTDTSDTATSIPQRRGRVDGTVLHWGSWLFLLFNNISHNDY